MVFTANWMGAPAQIIIEDPGELESVVSEAVKNGERGLSPEELKIGIEAFKTICRNECEQVVAHYMN